MQYKRKLFLNVRRGKKLLIFFNWLLFKISRPCPVVLEIEKPYGVLNKLNKIGACLKGKFYIISE